MVDAADDPYGIGGEVVTTNFVNMIVVSTFAPTGGTPRYDEMPAGDASTLTNKLEESLLDVMNVGWEQYEKRNPGISLEIKTSDGSSINYGFEPALGLHTDCYRTNETIVATAEGEVTNETAGVVLGVNGWMRTNKTTGVTTSGGGTSCSFVVENGDAYVLVWNIVTNKVKVTTLVMVDGSTRNDYERYGTVTRYGTMTPVDGWYPYGEYADFIIEPSDSRCYVESWIVEERAGDSWAVARKGGSQSELVSHCIEKPVKLTIRLRNVRGIGRIKAEYILSTTSIGVDEVGNAVELTGAPDSMVSGGGDIADGQVVADGDSIAVSNVVTTLTLESQTFEDDDGNKWRHYGWVLQKDGSAELSIGQEDIEKRAIARFQLTGDSTLVRIWIPDDGEGPDEPSTIKVSVKWNDTLDNLYAGDCVILSKSDVDALPPGTNIVFDRTSVPLGWKLNGEFGMDGNGNYVVPLALDEEVLAPKGVGGSAPLTIYPNADGTLTVEAKVSNAVRGFWYSLYSSDELGAEGWSMVTSGYTDGEPSVQQKTDDPPGVGEVRVWIKVKPEEQRRFYKLVVED